MVYNIIMIEHLSNRQPKKDCQYCYGSGEVVIDWDINGGEYWGQVIDIPHYGPCECLSRWYDPILIWWQETKWRIWVWRHSTKDDIPF